MARDEQDPFDDVKRELQGYGVFDGVEGEGIKNHYGSKEKASPNGIDVTLRCDSCGVTNQVHLDWPELVIIANSHAPSGWQMSENHGGYVLTSQGCRSCGSLLPLVYLPDAAERQLNASVKSGVVSAVTIRQINQQLQAQLNQQRR